MPEFFNSKISHTFLFRGNIYTNCSSCCNGYSYSSPNKVNEFPI
jgi:hypothetical protein